MCERGKEETDDVKRGKEEKKKKDEMRYVGQLQGSSRHSFPVCEEKLLLTRCGCS